ncbi:IS630 family transposase, partial [Candidatus Contendibacter odensensis]|uniref:IS630 family transposase n=1 Tax=Candidatus Contendibacter odensensis TaxID=1400860 RepID=UPI0012B6A523
MPLPKYIVHLTTEERTELEDLIRTGKRAASVIIHARILLKADTGANGPGWDDDRMAEAVECGASTGYRVRQAFVEESLAAALFRKKPTGRQYRKLDGAQEAHLIALACGAVPEGRSHWTLQLLADRRVELNVVESISPECVRVTLKKNELKPWLRQQWGIPPQANAEFVCAMEDVLEVYTRPYDPARPVICRDEISKQWVAQTRLPIPAQPGQPERVDDEYERRGTANLFLTCEPLVGQRHVTVTGQRTAVDFAHEVRDLREVRYPHAEKGVLVMDHLNTHKPAALYQAFEPALARSLIERLEIHHTPKHGSGLNRAEIELSILSRQCLDRRIPDADTLTREVIAWEQARNACPHPVNWR